MSLSKKFNLFGILRLVASLHFCGTWEAGNSIGPHFSPLVADDVNCTGNSFFWTPTCIDFHSNLKSFDDAEIECSQKYYNNHLCSIPAKIINNFGLLANYNINITHLNEAWIGLSMEYGNLKWNDGEKVDFVNWNFKDANHSLNLKEKYCISFNLTDGTWLPKNCAEKKPFFCGISWDVYNDSTPTTIPPSLCKNPCFQGDCIFNKNFYRCYALYTNIETFNDAELKCSGNGGHLLSLSNLGENDELFYFTYTDFFFSIQEAWIGMYIFESHYSWTDNTTVTYNNLQPNYTVDANKKYCVSFAFLEKYWKVADCNEKKLFLCSIPNSTATTTPFISSTTTPILTSTNSFTKSTVSSTTLVTTTFTSSTRHKKPQFLPTSTISTSITANKIPVSSLSSKTTTPLTKSKDTTSTFLSTLTPTTMKSLNSSTSKFKIWELLLGISILIIITSAFIGFYVYRRRKQAKERKKFLQGHVKSMMESVLHMFKQGYDKRDKWKLEENDVHINLNKILGKGFNATVYAGTFKEANTYESTSAISFLTKKPKLDIAIKVPKDFEKENVETFVRELDALITIESHPHIIKFFGWMLYENTPVFILELATISLLEYTKNFREEKESFPHKNMLSFLWQISQALIYISSKMMIHRDVACRNVLLTDTNVAKLADFGLCCHCNETFIYQAQTNKRLPFKWLSVEAIVDSIFSEKSDVWAFGILAHEAYSFGAIPYSTLTCAETLEFLQAGSRLEKPAEAFETLYELMLKCWEKDVETRPKFKDVEKYLRIMLENETFKYGYLALDSPSITSSSGTINVLQ